MEVYRLDPIPRQDVDPRWEVSAIKKTCWIVGHSEEDARQQVARLSAAMVKVKLGETLLRSPWLDPELASCEPDTAPVEMREGIVVTVDGDTHS
jgi:hypothetical protein